MSRNFSRYRRSTRETLLLHCPFFILLLALTYFSTVLFVAAFIFSIACLCVVLVSSRTYVTVSDKTIFLRWFLLKRLFVHIDEIKSIRVVYGDADNVRAVILETDFEALTVRNLDDFEEFVEFLETKGLFVDRVSDVLALRNPIEFKALLLTSLLAYIAMITLAQMYADIVVRSIAFVLIMALYFLESIACVRDNKPHSRSIFLVALLLLTMALFALWFHVTFPSGHINEECTCPL